MNMEQLPNHIVYSSNVIEFVTVAAEICLFFERAIELPKEDFICQSVKLLPLLYFKVSVIERPETIFEDEVQRFVTEDDYLFVCGQLEQLLGADDTYLETFHPDMPYSDTPIAVFVSENLSDVYQELKDFAANYQTGETDIMNDALACCLDTFSEHWGAKLLSSLRALHELRHKDSFGQEDDESIHADQAINRNKFFDYMNED
ncbi:MAG: DUF5063 domain-containing protein [Prevotellaceae bacterium]|jgi:hypothetical protein|nr:DUF5063 domain-containing protein [Prevotellaceae bacterium]